MNGIAPGMAPIKPAIGVLTFIGVYPSTYINRDARLKNPEYKLIENKISNPRIPRNKENKIAEFNEFDFDRIEVGHITRGSKINSIKYRSSDLDLLERYPNVVVKKYTEINDSIEDKNTKLIDRMLKKIKKMLLYRDRLARLYIKKLRNLE